MLPSIHSSTKVSADRLLSAGIKSLRQSSVVSKRSPLLFSESFGSGDLRLCHNSIFREWSYEGTTLISKEDRRIKKRTMSDPVSFTKVDRFSDSATLLPPSFQKVPDFMSSPRQIEIKRDYKKDFGDVMKQLQPDRVLTPLLNLRLRTNRSMVRNVFSLPAIVPMKDDRTVESLPGGVASRVCLEMIRLRNDFSGISLLVKNESINHKLNFIEFYNIMIKMRFDLSKRDLLVLYKWLIVHPISSWKCKLLNLYESLVKKSK